MPRQVATVVNNSFARGLITEATGLNFPENAVTDADNTKFEKVGRATRRRGIDLELNAIAKAYNESEGIVHEYVWNSVAKTGGVTFLVIQIGSEVFFYELTINEALSNGILPGSITLDLYKAPGAGDISHIPCSFTSGQGYLFCAHPRCDPVIVRFNDVEDQFEIARIRILTRDFEGEEDGLGVSVNPSTLTKEHQYNLRNQGWYKTVRAGASNNGGGGTTEDQPIAFPLVWEDLG